MWTQSPMDIENLKRTNLRQNEVFKSMNITCTILKTSIEEGVDKKNGYT